jgi:four helix bundle protein
MQDFRNVDTWNKAHGLVLRVYHETKSLPRDEVFGITMLLRRSATAIASRIAEGCGREINSDFAVDLRKAAAHCSELEYLVLLARDLHLWTPTLSEELMASAVEIRKMTFGLLRKL